MVDDFMGNSGLIEGTAAAFVNTWRASATCPDISVSFGHPCSLSFNNGMACLLPCHIISYHVCLIIWRIHDLNFGLMMGVLSCNYFIFACSSENYAQFWCAKITDPSGVFSPCHSIINPESYKDVSLPIKHCNVLENNPHSRECITPTFAWIFFSLC